MSAGRPSAGRPSAGRPSDGRPSDGRLDPRRVQQALVSMLLDPDYAARVRGKGSVPELSPRERALLRAVDPRALATDPHRRARAVHALVDELPVSAAVLGLSQVEAFFSTEAFRAGVRGRESMALTFARWLGDRARGVGRLEGAMAAVRRPGPPPRGEVACASRLRGLIVPEGTLAFTLRVREQLGPQPLERLAHRRKPWDERPPRRGTEPLLVERREDGSLDLGTASEPLVRLLRFAEGGRTRTEVEAQAIRLGAEPSEASELVDELLTDGLLCTPSTDPI